MKRLLAIVVGLVALVALLPAWWPWVLRPIANRLGLEYADYRRLSYARFALTDARLEQPGITAHARQVELLVPHVWLWRAWRGRAEIPVRVDDWRAEIELDRPAQRPPAEPANPTEIIHRLGRWLPQLELTDGLVVAGPNEVTVPFARWQTGNFEVRAEADAPVRVRLRAHGTVDTAYIDALEIQTDWLDLRATEPITLHRTGKLLDKPARFTAALRDPNFVIRGELIAEPGPGYWPVVGFTATATRGPGTLAVAGTTQFQPGQLILQLREFTWLQAGQPVYRLAEPIPVRIENNVIQVTGLRWVGTDRELTLTAAVNWPRQGEVELHGRGLRSEDFRGLLDLTGVRVAKVDAAARWDNGPVTGTLSWVGNWNDRVLRGDLLIDPNRVEVRSLEVAGAASATGHLPVRWVPGKPVEVLPDAPVYLRATTNPESPWWRQLAVQTGIQFVRPQVRLEIDGTPAEPTGFVRAGADSVVFDLPGRRRLPQVEGLALEVALQRDAVVLQRLRVKIENQPVMVTGRLPLPEDYWRSLLERPHLPDWQPATARLQVVQAEVAAFAPFFPEVLSPQGRLSVDVRLEPGLQAEGQILLTNAAVRPVLPLGTIRDIHADVRIHGRTATLATVRGTVGGQPVDVTGQVNWAGRGPPTLALAVRGTAVPLVREPGFILRSDLDLRLTQAPGQPTTLWGEVRPVNSIFLQNLNVLVPGQVAQPRQRPPYFSVEQPPFAGWELAVRVRGDRFLRVNSPLFTGVVSADFELTGTLREPAAIGEARVNEGNVLFPFATLGVTYGAVTLPVANPYRPEIVLTAVGQTFGFRVIMNVAGPVDAPVITFSSVPPLPSEQVLLMVTAGELPRELPGFTTQQKATRLAMYLGRTLLSRLGLDEAAAQRLTVRSGEEISRDGSLTYWIEYQLAPRWSIFAEYDRFNTFNAGVKYRVYSR